MSRKQIELIHVSGAPEDIVKAKRSRTGQFLKPVLERREGGGRKKRIERRSNSAPPQKLISDHLARFRRHALDLDSTAQQA